MLKTIMRSLHDFYGRPPLTHKTSSMFDPLDKCFCVFKPPARGQMQQIHRRVVGCFYLPSMIKVCSLDMTGPYSRAIPLLLDSGCRLVGASRQTFQVALG